MNEKRIDSEGFSCQTETLNLAVSIITTDFWFFSCGCFALSSPFLMGIYDHNGDITGADGGTVFFNKILLYGILE